MLNKDQISLYKSFYGSKSTLEVGNKTQYKKQANSSLILPQQLQKFLQRSNSKQKKNVSDFSFFRCAGKTGQKFNSTVKPSYCFMALPHSLQRNASCIGLDVRNPFIQRSAINIKAQHELANKLGNSQLVQNQKQTLTHKRQQIYKQRVQLHPATIQTSKTQKQKADRHIRTLKQYRDTHSSLFDRQRLSALVQNQYSKGILGVDFPYSTQDIIYKKQVKPKLVRNTDTFKQSEQKLKPVPVRQSRTFAETGELPYKPSLKKVFVSKGFNIINHTKCIF